MEHIMNLLYWLKDNYIELLSSLGVILMGLEMLVRLTPTKKDDSALERVGSKLRKAMDMLKVPNIKVSSDEARKEK